MVIRKNIEKVKIFASIDMEKLEGLVNDFIQSSYKYQANNSDRTFELIDIRYSRSDLHTCMAIYKTDVEIDVANDPAELVLRKLQQTS